MTKQNQEMKEIMKKSEGNLRRVMRRGGSLMITIPAAFAAQLEIKEGDVVAVETNGRELIIRKVKK